MFEAFASEFAVTHLSENREFAKLHAIIARKVPELDAALRARVVVLVQALRGLDLFKKPGVAESIDFARALCVLKAESLSDELVRQGLGVLLKVQDDIVLATEQLPALLGSTVQ
ncbi:MAG: hypothetical protein EBW74_10480 [Betaproteobacteria bacterium]|nr:hypothetical protein [Betaproteobacteria bacterium]